ncbi:MAG: hypothetical protein KY397_05645 [Gemmatimonadetes bacterium]|nr:hypothetical protein [Gemmatimonadota bacterium]
MKIIDRKQEEQRPPRGSGGAIGLGIVFGMLFGLVTGLVAGSLLWGLGLGIVGLAAGVGFGLLAARRRQRGPVPGEASESGAEESGELDGGA